MHTRLPLVFTQAVIIISLFFLLPGISVSIPVLADKAKQQVGVKTLNDLTTDQAVDLNHERYRILFDELEKKHGFSAKELVPLFSGLKVDKRVLELMDRQWEAKPYYQYFPLFITPGNIAKGRQKLQEHHKLLDRIEREIGVDREIVMAIWAIESKFGSHQGRYEVFRTLNSLFAHYPRRSSFFRTQLIEFLLLCRENDVAVKSVYGSYAGAFGQTQFIPSSFRTYAVSFDGDNKRDVWNSVPDILASIASYLKHFHWTLGGTIYYDLGSDLKDKRLIAAFNKGRKGKVSWQIIHDIQMPNLPLSPGNARLTVVGLENDPANGGGMRYIAGYSNFQAITKWNNSNRYAMAVTQLAEKFKEGQ